MLNDVIGYTEAAMPQLAAGGYREILAERLYLMNAIDYRFTMDLDVGMSWKPDWRFVQPKLSLDIYNLIGYFRDVGDSGERFPAAINRSLEHIRIGADITVFQILKFSSQYYNRYLSAGAGLDLYFLDFRAEIKIRQDVFTARDSGNIPLGADLILKIRL